MARVYLLKNVPLTNSYESTIDFDTAQQQYNYFMTFGKMSDDTDLDYQTIRINRSVEVPYSFEDLEGVNYLVYVNEDKVYYNFVTSKQYINPNNTVLSVDLDVFQTFMFDYTLGECFVEREHQDRYKKDEEVSNKLKAIISRTEENIDIGSAYYLNSTEEIHDLTQIKRNDNYVNVGFMYVWGNTPLSSEGDSKVQLPTMINGIPTSRYLYVIPMYLGDRYGALMPSVTLVDNLDTSCIFDSTNIGQAISALNALRVREEVVEIQISRYAPFKYTTYDKGNGVYGYYPDSAIAVGKRTEIYPVQFYNTDTKPFGGTYAYKITDCNLDLELIKENEIGYDIIKEINLGETKSINYEPKLLNYPYNYYKIRYGDFNIDWKPELFNDNKFKITKFVSPTEQGTHLFVPTNYRGLQYDYDTMLVSLNQNELGLTTAIWENYWTQNKASYRNGLITGVLGGIANAGAGIATGALTGGAVGAITGAVGGVMSTVNTVTNAVAKKQDLKATPPTTKMVGDDIGVSLFKGGVYALVENYGIDDQHKNIVFNYLYRNGYSVNNYKIPNTRSRYYFNFIKNIETILQSKSIESDYAEQLKQIYNNGVTIWHYRGADFNYQDYTKENWEVSLLN